MALKERNEIDRAYLWNLEDIYPNEAEWNRALDEVEARMQHFPALRGTLGENPESLKRALDSVNEAAEILSRVFNYAFLNSSGDNSDARFKEMTERAFALATRFETMTAFVRPEILMMDEETLKKFMKADGLSVYRHILEDVDRMRPYTLDAAREEMLAMLGDAAQTPDDLFTMFESVDMQFGDIEDANGEKHALSHGMYSVYRESKDSVLRRNAFEGYLGAFKAMNNTLAANYIGSVKMDCYHSKVRGYKGACEHALFADNIPTSIYDALTEAVHGALPSMQRYLKLRKAVLGTEDLHMYDLYVPIVEEVDFSVSYEEACAMVREALKPMGEDYIRRIDRAFAERWIDVYENRGKSTGAFSDGVYGVHPYVMLNFTGKLDDVFTLAHELGHAMHSALSDETQVYANHDYSLFVAEVASTTNEMLLTRYLLRTMTDEKKRAFVLNHLLEGFRTTVFRQALFAEFERKAHEAYEQGTPLTAQSLNAMFRALDETYYEGVTVDSIMDVEWSVIPHFYRAFYVYQYATGFSAAVTLSDRILNGGREDYLRFLSMGGSDYPIEELKVAGVDLTRPEAVAHALKQFDESITELADILGVEKI